MILMLCAFPARMAVAQQPQSVSLPSDAELRSLIAGRVDTMKKAVGMVIGVVTPQGRRVVSYGQLKKGDTRPLDGNTVFEIGSVTKVFTSLLLADMVRRGEVKLTDSLGKFFPPSLKMPRFENKPVTLVDLATNTSGYPFMPPDFPSREPEKFSTYTDAQILRFLSNNRPRQAPGSRWEYSNLGNTLLGRALANRARDDYALLVASRITRPLGMTSTAVIPTEDMKKRMATPHDAKLQPTRLWNVKTLEPSSSMYSTTNDLLTLIEAYMRYKATPLATSMQATLATRRAAPNFTQALGWWIVSFGTGDEGIITHSGETFGFSATVALDPKARVGVVVLSNGVENDGGLAWHLLRPSFPYTSAAAEVERAQRKEITLATATLNRYVGRYQPPTGVPITIERQGDALIFKSSVLPQGVRLRAEDDRTFFITEADMQITFELEGAAPAVALVVRFNGSDTRAARVRE
jgi:D-alanyl-D-alanine-carboxypeptidase/D-alanyl-D-alanine-endopeptidase